MMLRGKCQLICSIAFISLIGYGLALAIVESRFLGQVSAELRPMLEASLKDEIFGNSKTQAEDQYAIEGLLRKFNKILNDEIQPTADWLPVGITHVNLVSIGHIRARERSDSGFLTHNRAISFEIIRGKKAITVSVQAQFMPNIAWYFGWLALVILVKLVIDRRMQTPMHGFQEELYQLLKDRDYEDSNAVEIARQVDGRLVFTELQMGFIGNLLSRLGEEGFDLEQILAAVQRSNDELLQGESRKWLHFGLELGFGPEKALILAESENVVEYNPKKGDLYIRGLPIEMSKAPLLYYLWYLEKRLQGDGWVTNPRSKSMDMSMGIELEDCFERYGGDSRSLKRLYNTKSEMQGVSSDILRDMRSKIKKAITDVITEEGLAQVFLVNESRHSEKNVGGNDFRVGLSADQIHIDES